MTSFSLNRSLTYMKLKLWLKVGIFPSPPPNPKVFNTLLFLSIYDFVLGTLEGFSFDSEDEADKMPKAVSHQNEDVEEQANGKTKGKPEKTSVCFRTFFSSSESILIQFSLHCFCFNRLYHIACILF
jgi:hypothetical protein